MAKVKNKLPDKRDYSKYPFKNLSLTEMEGEKWMDIPEMDGYFLVSNFGRVWALDRPVSSTTGQFYYIRERIRKQHMIKCYNSFTKDYTQQLAVNLRYSGKNLRYLVNRLVYHNFIHPIDFKGDGLLVVHKDGDNCNNEVTNLVLMNGTELYGHGLGIKRRPRAGTTTQVNKHLVWNESNYPRAVVKYTLKGKKIAEFESVGAAAKANNTSRGSVRDVVTKRFTQLNGFIYRFKGDNYKGEFADFSWEKVVTQFTIEGKKLKTYPSVKEAAKSTGIDSDTISKCALQKFKLAGGYVWRYDGDTYKGEYKGTIKNKAKAIIQFSLEGKIIKRFPSVTQAAIELGCADATLKDCALKITKVSHGYVWRYEGDTYKGEYKNYRRGKPVTQFTLQKKKMRTYPTMEEAAKITGLTPDNIQKNVQGHNKTAGGFIWHYATEKEIKSLPAFRQTPYTLTTVKKEVVQYTLEGKKLANYASPAGAAKALGTYVSGINQAMDKENRTHAGFVWRSKGKPYGGELAKNPPANKAQQVTQYDLRGNRIKVFKSMRDAEKALGIPSTTISLAARGKLKKTGGFIWKTGTSAKKIDAEEHFASTLKKYVGVVKYTLKGDWVAEYSSIAAAARAEGVAVSRISSVINKKQKSSVGHVWKRKGE